MADVSSDERTRTHPWAQGPDRIRFFAAAPVIGSDGRRIGTLEVMDRIRHRRIGRQQLRTLGHLSALTAQLLQAERRLR